MLTTGHTAHDLTSTEAEVLTIEEAAEILRIGRNAAYALARRWRFSGGTEGIPCVELGRTLRVPRRALNDLLAGRTPGPASSP